MGKKSSERLATVLKLAKMRQQLAAQVLAENIRNKTSHDEQLQQLQSFKDDYLDKFAQGVNLTSSSLMNYQTFYGSLEKAVEMQAQRTVLSQNQLEQARKQWQSLYAREKNMESLIDKKIKIEEVEEEKKIQAEQDDRFQRKVFGDA